MVAGGENPVKDASFSSLTHGFKPKPFSRKRLGLIQKGKFFFGYNKKKIPWGAPKICRHRLAR